MAEAAEYKKYQELTFDLGVERKDEELEISGDFILVEYLDGSAYIKLDNPGHDAIDLSVVKQIKTTPQKFNKIYITNTAQSGKTLKLLIGGAASFTAEKTVMGNVIIQDADGNKAVVDSTNNALHVKVTEQPVNSYSTDSISSVGNVLELDLGSFSGTGAGSSRDIYPAYRIITWQINSDSSATAHDVRLQGSLDNSNWFDLDTSNTTGNELRFVVDKPVRYLRVNVVSMGDASSISVKALLKDV